MRRAERLFRLVNALRSRDISRAEDLAEHLDVSTRTIYRDIAHLQGSGLPIDGEAGVGYLLRPGFDLPSVTLTYDQLDALAAGLSHVEKTGDPAMAEAAREVRAKVQANLPQPEDGTLANAPFLAVPRPVSPHVALVRHAIRERFVLLARYRDAKGVVSDRRLRPLAIWSFADGWMFTAWCELRQDFRTFRFDRVIGFCETGEVFAEEADKSLTAFLEQESCDGEPP